MAKIQILGVMNTDDDANGGGEILEYVTTVSKQKGTAWVAASLLLFSDPKIQSTSLSFQVSLML